ncbi:MAG: cache domain-containing protein [Eubacteriales bacterium]
MFKKVTAALIVGLLLVVGFGCSKKDESAQNNQTSSQSQLPSGQPGVDSNQGGQPSKPVNVKEVAEKVSKDLDAKFPGDWSVTGTTLKKGSYTENGKYKIVDELAGLYNGSMVSIFVGQDRIAGTIKDQTGQRVLAGYPTPDSVAKIMESGEALVAPGGAMGSANYQKVFLPIKSKGKTVAVISISIAQ